MNFRTSLISVILVITASNSKANLCPWDLPDLQLWSDFSTWEVTPPEEGESFVLTKKVLLDIETPPLGTIRIIDGGMIIFSPNHQVGQKIIFIDKYQIIMCTTYQFFVIFLGKINS